MSNSYFNGANFINIAQLLVFQGHFGGKASIIHPASAIFAFGRRFFLIFLDLRFSVFFIRRSLGLCLEISYKNGQTFFSGGLDYHSTFLLNLFDYWHPKSSNKLFIVACFHWFGGALTNFKMWSRFVNFINLFIQTASGDNFYSEKYSKNLVTTFGGLRYLHLVPPLVISFSLSNHLILKQETRILGIPLISFVDLSIDPVGVLYPIACNNLSLSLHFYILSIFLTGILIGRNRRVRHFRSGILRLKVYLQLANNSYNIL